MNNDGWFEVTPQDVAIIDAYNEIPHTTYHKLEHSDIIAVSKQSIGRNLRVGDKWPGYPFMTCVKVYREPHKWWQFWKWFKIVGYAMRFDKDDV